MTLAMSAAMLVWILLTSCTSKTVDPRTAWLQQQITRENQHWLLTSPIWLARKYEKMASSPYDYMRGTVGTYYTDLTRHALTQQATPFLQTPAASQILLFGDAHPENFGTMLPGKALPPFSVPLYEDQSITLDIQDLDAAQYGPWLLDLRRSALGVSVLTTLLHGCEAVCRSAVLTAQVEGYVSGALGEPRPTEEGRLLMRLRDEALEEGQAQKKLDHYTEIGENGQRVLSFVAMLDDEHRGIFALTDIETAQLARLLEGYDAIDGFRLLSAGRRYGSGVSSLAALRYVVLYDRGSDGLEDDALLNIRELVDPPIAAGLLEDPGVHFPDNASRIEAVSAQLWSQPDADAAARGLRDGQLSFKCLTWSSWVQDIERDKLIEQWNAGELAAADIIAMARVLGWTIGAGHRRALTAAGADAAPILEAELRGNQDTLLTELLEAAAEDLATTFGDHQRFRRLLLDTGPFLGAK